MVMDKFVFYLYWKHFDLYFAMNCTPRARDKKHQHFAQGLNFLSSREGNR